MSFVFPSSSPEISSALLPRFLALIGVRTGLHIRDKDRGDVQRILTERFKHLKIMRAESYLQLLEAQTSLHQSEWAYLLPRLTNGESYFWRDKGQFSLLRNQILPELIEARSSSRSLRLWSAGCSTGEEPYSLAMLVDELMPRRDGWNITILGTDINPASLEKAREGIYGAWAFRGLDISVQERYFERGKGRNGTGFQISSQMRSMVTFAGCNLRGDEFPSRVSGIVDMDLILCRNVLIYFEREAIAHALAGFGRTLREGGYLLTGHAELANHDPAPLVVRTFAESVAYQRCQQPAKAAPRPLIAVAPQPPNPLVSTAPPVVRLPAPPAIDIPSSPRSAFGAAFEALAVPPAPVAPSISKNESPAEGQAAALELCKKARMRADLGHYDEAARLCSEALARDTTCDDAYFVWGQVEIERGNPEEAKTLFKKVIYLAPERYDVHLELAALYDAEYDAPRARRERLAALQLLRHLRDGELLSSHPGVQAAELRVFLEQQLQNTAAENINSSRPRGAR